MCSPLWTILICKIPQCLAKSYQFRQLITVFQKADTLRLVNIYIMFCPPAGAKYPLFQAPPYGLYMSLYNYQFYLLIPPAHLFISFCAIIQFQIKGKHYSNSLLINNIENIRFVKNLYLDALKLLYLPFLILCVPRTYIRPHCNLAQPLCMHPNNQ